MTPLYDFPCGFPQGFLRRSQRNKRQRQIRTGVLPHLSIETTSFSLLSLSLVTSSFSWHLLAHQQEWLNGFKGRNTANQRYPALLASNRGCQPIQGCTTLMDFPRKKTIGNCWTTKSWFVAALAVGGCCLKIWTPKAIWRFRHIFIIYFAKRPSAATKRVVSKIGDLSIFPPKK